MVGRRLEPRGLDRRDDAPERLAGEQRRGGLDHRQAARGEAPLEQPVERRGVELAEREVVRVGEVDDDEVEVLAGRPRAT